MQTSLCARRSLLSFSRLVPLFAAAAVVLCVPAFNADAQVDGPPSLDAQVVAGLMLRDDPARARIIADRFIKDAPDKAGKTSRRRELSRTLLSTAQRPTLYHLSPDEDLALRSKILERAGSYLQEAGKADPEVAKSHSFRTEVALLKQRRAQLISSVLPRIRDAKKSEHFHKEAEDVYGEALAIYKRLCKEQGGLVRKVERQPPPQDAKKNEAWLDKIDEEDGKWGAVRLRKAICEYQLAMLAGPGKSGKKERILKRLDEGKGEFVDLEFRYNFYQFITHIHYYWGLVKMERGKYKGALEQFQKGFESEDTRATRNIRLLCHHGRTKVRIALGDYARALAEVERILRAVRLTQRDSFVVDRVRVNARWAVDLLEKGAEDKAQERFEAAVEGAVELLRAGSQKKSNAMEIVVDASKDAKGAFQIDYHVLEEVAKTARREEQWMEAVDAYRQLTTITRLPRERRDAAAYYLAYSYYKADRLLEAAITASWAADTVKEDSERLSDADSIAISALSKLAKPDVARKEDLPFFKKLLLKERLRSTQRPIDQSERKGNPRFSAAHELEQSDRFRQAIISYKKLEPGETYYDRSLFRIGECLWELARAEKRRNPASAAIELVKARKAYEAARDYYRKNPGETPEEKHTRKGLLGQCIFRIASIEIDPTIYRSAYERLKTARGPMVKTIVEEAAENAGQPDADLGSIKSSREALVALKKLQSNGLKRTIELTNDFRSTYKSLDRYFPYIHFMRLQAFVRLGDDTNAEKEVTGLQQCGKRGEKLLSKSYDILRLLYHRLGERHLNSTMPGDRDRGVTEKKKSLTYTLLSIEKSEQPASVYEFLAALSVKYVTPELRDRVIKAIDEGLKKRGDEDREQKGTRHMVYVLAKLALDADKIEKARGHYEDLNNYFTKLLEEKPDTEVDMLHAVRLGLADCRVATDQFEKGIQLYNKVGSRLRPGDDDWWNIIFKLVKAYSLWGKHHDAYRIAADKQKIRPSMGEKAVPGLRQRFIDLFESSLPEIKDDDLKADVKRLVEAMKQYEPTE